MKNLSDTTVVEVLNGQITTGDRVAFCYKNGNSADMAVGIVVGFKEMTVNKYHASQPATIIRVMIRYSRRSVGTFNRETRVYESESVTDFPSHLTGVERHDKIVKLSWGVDNKSR